MTAEQLIEKTLHEVADVADDAPFAEFAMAYLDGIEQEIITISVASFGSFTRSELKDTPRSRLNKIFKAVIKANPFLSEE